VLIDQTLDDFYKRNNLNKSDIYDERLLDLEIKTNEWLSAIEEPDRAYFLKLLESFTYCDYKSIHLLCKKLYESYSKLVVDNKENTVYVPVTAEGGIYCGADYLMGNFTLANRLNVKKGKVAIRPNQYNDYIWQLDTIKNVVLIDDIIGTGTTFRYSLLELIKRCPKLFLEDKNIYLMALYITGRGKRRLKSISKEIGRNINLIPCETIRSAFTGELIFNNHELKLARHIIKKYELRVVKRNDDIMGYEGSQALLGFYYNTPNNTLSTFWCTNDSCNWKPIFPREEETGKLPTIREMKEKKGKQAGILYNIVVEANKGDGSETK
jgi:hypothetical protein